MKKPTQSDIKALLKEFDLTPGAAGELLGIGKQSMKKWASGKKPMSSRVWGKLLDATKGRKSQGK